MEFVVLGFTGESNSGKDFCGRWVANNKGFARVAFADTIKRFLRTVFDFDYENLWGDPKYRNQEVVPCTGGHAVASTLLHQHWDRALENMALNVHDWANELALTTTEKAEYIKVVGRWFDECRQRTDSSMISVRMAIQLLGTEYGRGFKPTIWTDYVFEKIIPRIQAGEYYAKEAGIVPNRYVTTPGVLITDHRYLNEIQATQAFGGHVVKLIRLSNEGKDNEAVAAGIEGHSSEYDQRNFPDEYFDQVLKLEEGEDKVFPLLERLFQEQGWCLPSAT